jgi:hypothetical protein
MSNDFSKGRPTVITDEVVRKLEDAFREGFSVNTACELSGISRSTYYEHLNSNEAFSDKMVVARQWVNEKAKQVIIKAIDKDDIKAAQWWLERKARDEFGANIDIREQKIEPYREQRKDMAKVFEILRRPTKTEA